MTMSSSASGNRGRGRGGEMKEGITRSFDGLSSGCWGKELSIHMWALEEKFGMEIKMRDY